MEKYEQPEFCKVDPDLTTYTADKLRQNSEHLVGQFNSLLTSEQKDLEEMKEKSYKLMKIFEHDINEDYIE
jgi:hypothetical protein